MRQIKFRAWDSKAKEWAFNIGLDIYGLTGFLSNKEQMDKDLTFAQFTGLKDKNGKEIYEGDLINYTTSRLVDDVWEVIWHAGGFYTRDKTKGLSPLVFPTLASTANIEVRGNIYENPNLLENG